MIRILLALIGVSLVVQGAVEFAGLAARGWTLMATMWAAIALGGGIALAVGAWRSDAATVARWFKSRPGV